MKLPGKWKIALTVVGMLAAVNLLLLKTWPSINDVRTGGTPQYPEIQPRVYPLPLEVVFDASAAVARAMPGWTVLSADPKTSVIEAVAQVRWTPFQDDVTIRVTEEGNQSVINVRSRSRVGKGDLGVNARRIRHYLEALDARIGSRSAQRSST